MRAPKNIPITNLRQGLLRTRVDVDMRIRYLMGCIDENNLKDHANCKENRQMRCEICRLKRYYRWLTRRLKEVQWNE